MTRISNITIAEQSEYCFLAIRKTIDFMVEFSEFSKQSFEKFLNIWRREEFYLQEHRLYVFITWI